MSEMEPDTDARVREEADRFVSGLRVNPGEGLFAENEWVCVAMDPWPRPESGALDLLVTVFPLVGSGSCLEALTFTLTPVDGGVTCFGRLSRRGQLRLLSVQPGPHRCRLFRNRFSAGGRSIRTPAGSAVQPEPGGELALPLAAASGARTRSGQADAPGPQLGAVFSLRTADGRLDATVTVGSTGHLDLELRSRDRTLDGLFVPVAWDRGDRVAPDAEPLHVVVVLSWDETEDSCRGGLSLGQVTSTGELFLSFGDPTGSDALTAEWTSEISASVARLDRAHDRRAWWALVESSRLAPEAAEAARAGLAQEAGRASTATMSWGRALGGAYALGTRLSVALQPAQPLFRALPPGLTAALMTLAARGPRPRTEAVRLVNPDGLAVDVRVTARPGERSGGLSVQVEADSSQVFVVRRDGPTGVRQERARGGRAVTFALEPGANRVEVRPVPGPGGLSFSIDAQAGV